MSCFWRSVNYRFWRFAPLSPRRQIGPAVCRQPVERVGEAVDLASVVAGGEEVELVKEGLVPVSCDQLDVVGLGRHVAAMPKSSVEIEVADETRKAAPAPAPDITVPHHRSGEFG
jgi:hypothetical protein